MFLYQHFITIEKHIKRKIYAQYGFVDINSPKKVRQFLIGE